MAKLSDSLNVNLHPRENLLLSSTIASVTTGANLRADGTSTVFLSLTGTFVATVLVEGSIDNVTWITIPMRPVNAASKLLVLSATAIGQFVASHYGYSFVRIRCSAYTSGTVAYSVATSNAVVDNSLEGLVANSSVTATGTSGAAVTLTLPAPVAGFRQYLTNVRLERHAAALLIAGATPTIITTTNLPGARAYSMPVEAAAAGTIYEKREEFAIPLAASAQATAVTFVAGAVTSTIWRMIADYYVAP